MREREIKNQQQKKKTATNVGTTQWDKACSGSVLLHATRKRLQPYAKSANLGDCWKDASRKATVTPKTRSNTSQYLRNRPVRMKKRRSSAVTLAYTKEISQPIN
jgi:hypothetical protein